jgi:hypothetical protein
MKRKATGAIESSLPEKLSMLAPVLVVVFAFPLESDV